MKSLRFRSVSARWLLLLALAAPCAGHAYPQAQAAPKPVGTVQSVSANAIILKSDSGPSLTISITPQTKVLRAAPGQSLKDATPIPASEIQAGDRMLARGAPGSEANSLTATTLVIMAKSDVAQRQQQELQAWTRNGTGGLVASIDPQSGTITLKTTPGNSVIVHTSPQTEFLRYASSSTRFADATPSSLAQIKDGDQLRARGVKSPDGKEFTAAAVIAGSFRNIAGTISSIDPAARSLVIKDLLAKENVTVSFAPDSQIKKLPPPLAMRIGMMLKRGGPAPQAPSAAVPGAAPPEHAPEHTGATPDFQQIVTRLPAISLAELQKGDAVILVATPGSNGSGITAITLISGVEPILTAAPSGSGAASLLSNWNISSGEGAGGGGPQ